MDKTEAMMEFLFARRTSNLPGKGLAEVFDRLIWCMNDQGAELLEVRKKWVKGEDREKVQIALAMNEVFPCNNREEMTQLFAKVTGRWPDLKDLCQAVLVQWDRQMGT